MSETGRAMCLTQKVSTDFGSMYMHLELNEHGIPVGGSISTPQKDDEQEIESQITKLVRTLSAGLDQLLRVADVGNSE